MNEYELAITAAMTLLSSFERIRSILHKWYKRPNDFQLPELLSNLVVQSGLPADRLQNIDVNGLTRMYRRTS